MGISILPACSQVSCDGRGEQSSALKEDPEMGGWHKEPNSNGLHPKIQPRSDGLPSSDGLQPRSDGLVENTAFQGSLLGAACWGQLAGDHKQSIAVSLLWSFEMTEFLLITATRKKTTMVHGCCLVWCPLASRLHILGPGCCF